MGHNFSGMHSLAYGRFPVLLLILILIAVLVVAFLVTRKHDSGFRKDLSVGQKASLENFQPLVLAMLTQQGTGLTQIEICKNLGLPCEVTAEKILEMEKAGLIAREWENENYTFVVKKAGRVEETVGGQCADL